MKTRKARKNKRKYEITSIDKILIIKEKVKVKNTKKNCSACPEIWKINKILLMQQNDPEYSLGNSKRDKKCNGNPYDLRIVFDENTIDRWTKGCNLPFPKKGDLAIIKTYSGITFISIVDNVYNAQLYNCIEPEIEKILRKNQNCFQKNWFATSIDSNNPSNIRRSSCKKKKRGDTIICRFLQDIWFHTQREDRANTSSLLLQPWKGSLIKTQTQILDNRSYYTRNIELHRKGKKSRTVRITRILICYSGSKISQF